MSTRSILGLFSILASACQANGAASLEAKSMSQIDANASANASLDDKLASSSSTNRIAPTSDSNDDAAALGSVAGNAMLGARAGLHLAKPAAPNCQCVGIVVGQPTDPRFLWEGPVPNTNAATQLVIGLSSESLPCPSAPADSLGASYHGYEVVGSDVVVEVEASRFGRPVAQGAVIPKPPPDGRVLVRPVDGSSPYGRGSDGKSANCRVWPAQ